MHTPAAAAVLAAFRLPGPSTLLFFCVKKCVSCFTGGMLFASDELFSSPATASRLRSAVSSARCRVLSFDVPSSMHASRSMVSSKVTLLPAVQPTCGHVRVRLPLNAFGATCYVNERTVAQLCHASVASGEFAPTTVVRKLVAMPFGKGCLDEEHAVLAQPLKGRADRNGLLARSEWRRVVVLLTSHLSRRRTLSRHLTLSHKLRPHIPAQDRRVSACLGISGPRRPQVVTVGAGIEELAAPRCFPHLSLAELGPL